MYKIMTKLHTKGEGIYRFYMVYDEDNKLVEYATEDKEEAAETALELLRTVGYKDLRIVDDIPYYINVEKTDDPGVTEEDIKRAEKILGRVGYDDLFLNHDAKYDVIWNWGTKPEPEPETYTLTFIDDANAHWDYSEITNIEAGSIRVNSFTIDGDYNSFHLIINGDDCSAGLPDWVDYTPDYIYTFNNIQDNYEIKIVID